MEKPEAINMKIVRYENYDERKYFLTRHVTFEMLKHGFSPPYSFEKEGGKSIRKQVEEYINKQIEHGNFSEEDIEMVVYRCCIGTFKDIVEIYIKFKGED